MDLTKQNITQIVQESGAKEWVRNLQIMGDSIIIDAISPSPAMHDKKKLQEALTVPLQKKFPQAKIEIRIRVEQTKAPKTTEMDAIQGKQVPGIKNVIAVASGKGGVGKSTVTANLAISLQKMGFSVGILDADIYGPSMPLMFDTVHEKPASRTIEGKSKMVPVESYGVKLLSIGFFTQLNQAVVWRGAMASKALQQLIHDADWGKLDFLLIDLPPGTGDIHLSIVQQIPVTGSIIVSTPQQIALADVQKGVSMFKLDAINVPVLGFVENMAYFTPEELPTKKYHLFGKDGVKNLADQMEIPFLGEIPIQQSIREAADSGRPAALQENSSIATAYKEITQNMLRSLLERNDNLPPTEVVRITTLSGCATK